MACALCEKRKAERFCPAKAEKICAVCCGTEREVSIDCPAGCGYLVAAHRYEDQHARSLPADTPLRDVRITSDTIQAHRPLLSAIAFAIAKFCAAQPSTTDADVIRAIRALGDTYKTLASGIVYEQPPAMHLQRELYDALSLFLTEARQNASEASFGNLKDSEIFHLLVFLHRTGLLRTNGRPRSRRFIEFLRGQFPGAKELKREESRIIVP